MFKIMNDLNVKYLFILSFTHLLILHYYIITLKHCNIGTANV